MMLKMSTQFENNSIPGMEAPGLVIEDVMKSLAFGHEWEKLII